MEIANIGTPSWFVLVKAGVAHPSDTGIGEGMARVCCDLLRNKNTGIDCGVLRSCSQSWARGKDKNYAKN
jgi:hypothetical protein